MTIFEILEKLKNVNPEARVYFDFCNCFPTTVNSWRGIYAEPAIGWSSRRISGDEPQTVERFVNRLEEAISGTIFQGYKGGDYTFRGNQELHVDNWGEYSRTSIKEIKIDTFVLLVTEDNSEYA